MNLKSFLLWGLIPAAALPLCGAPARAQTIEEIRRQYSPDRIYDAAEVGVKVDLPAGWNLLKPGSIKIPGAIMVAYYEPTRCLAALWADGVAPSTTLDDYLSGVVKAQAGSLTSLSEDGRESFRFGGREGKVVSLSWVQSGTRMRGVHIVCADDFHFYRFFGVANQSHWAQAFPAIKKLAAGFSITKSTDDRISELARRMADQCPFVTLKGAAVAMREAVKKHIAADASAGFGMELTEKGRTGVPPQELAEFDRLFRTAIWGLDIGDHALLEQFFEGTDFVKTHSHEQAVEVLKLLKEAIETLPPGDRARLQAIGDKIWTAGVAIIDATAP